MKKLLIILLLMNTAIVDAIAEECCNTSADKAEIQVNENTQASSDIKKLKFTELDEANYPFKIREKLEKKALNRSKCKLRVNSIRGTKKSFEVGGSYIIIGELRCSAPSKVTVYAGVTNIDNNGARDLEGYTRYHYPTEKKQYFKLGFTMGAPGEFHVTAYARKDEGTDWNAELFDLRLK